MPVAALHSASNLATEIGRAKHRIRRRMTPWSETFLLDVTDPSGASVAAITKIATYETYTPNGEACDPVCFRAVFADSAP